MDKKCEICGKTMTNVNVQKRFCDECKKQREKESRKIKYIKNKEKYSERAKQYYLKNKEKILCRVKIYSENNSEKIKKQNKVKYEKNKDTIIKRVDKWRKNNPEKRKDICKRYRQKRNERLKVDDNFRAQYKTEKFMRDSILRCFKQINTKKNNNTYSILGCTPEQLRQRLEMNFKPDMNWNNYGKVWNIDHRKPLKRFNLLDENNNPNYIKMRIANSLANLKPMYCSDNFSKCDRFIGDSPKENR